MTEMRRIELSSVKPPEKDLKAKKKVKTIRLVLSLGESNATSCPEYSYAELIKSENERNETSSDPFGDDDEHREVAAIAQRFEAKYGTKSFKSGKKKQTQDMDDYYDVGDGYDEDDPFIDNTEAYDEVVPSTLTTKYGGFYINQGKLDFKSISDDSNDTFAKEKDKKKLKHKRKIIESDSEEETGETLAKKFKAMKRKKLLEGREAEKKKKKLGSTMNGDISVKKKKKKNLLKLKQSSRDGHPMKDASTPKVTSVDVKTTPSTVVTPVVATTIPASVTVSTVTVTTPTGLSVNGTAQSEEKNGTADDVVMKIPSHAVPIAVTKDDSSSRSDDEKKMETPNEEKNTQLPNQLPVKLKEDIATIKEYAKNSKEGKSKFFSGTINNLLLTIENESLKLSKSQRSGIFNYLGEHLPSGKHTLLRRAKKLRQLEDKQKEPIDKLNEAIRKMMPKLIEEHQALIAKTKLDAKANGADATNEEVATESDEEEGNKVDTKKTRRPRRKFSWNSEITDLYLEVVQAKMNIFKTFKVQQQAPDEYLKTFLDSEIKPLWPSGWMNTRALLKIAKDESSKSVKPKKTVSGKVSPIPVSDSANPSQHVSKMDDVIEISSIIDDDVEEKKNVVINLPGSEVKPPVSCINPQSLPSVSSFRGPLIPSNMQMGNVKPETISIPSKSIDNVPLVTTVKLSDKSVKVGSVTSFSRSTPPTPTVIELWESPPKNFPRNILSTPSVIEISESPVKPTTVKHDTFISTPIPKAASTPVLAGSNAASSTSVNNRSFLQALDPPGLHKEGPLPSKPQVSLLSPQQQQHKSSSISNNVFQQHKKVQQSSQVKNSMQPKMGSNSQHKLTQESKVPHMLQKTSMAGGIKDLSPIVSMSRIPTTGMTTNLSKQSTSLSLNKNTYSPGQNRLPFANQRSPQANLTSQIQQQNVGSGKKKQPQISSPLQSQTVTSSFASLPNSSSKKPGPGGLPVNLLSNSAESIKQPSIQTPSSPAVNATSNNQVLFLKKTSAIPKTVPGSQVKSGIVLGTSLPKFKPQSDQQRNLLHAQNYQQRSSAGISLATPPKPLSIQTSSLSSSLGSNKNTSPPNKILQSSTSLLSFSRTSTPSPQKSPASPGNTASSLFDRIQSQILNQEATQEQGLKVLAMAMKIEGSVKPQLGQGKGQDSPGNW